MKSNGTKSRGSSKQDVWEIRQTFKRSPLRAVLFHSVYILTIYGYWFMYRVKPFNNFGEVFRLFLFSSCYVAVSYYNIFILFNNYLVRRNLPRYIFFTIVSYTLAHYFSNLGHSGDLDLTKVFRDPDLFEYFRSYLLGFICFMMFTAIGVLYFIIQLLLNEEEKVLNLEKENVKSKLQQLRNQVNPHFLFNTFNNLYVLNKTNPLKAGDLILGLSDLMHYQLHETNEEKVLLSKEMEYIDNYLNLEKIRKEDFSFSIEYNVAEIADTRIEPLLLITLVENAIKHGVNVMEKGFISIHLSVKNNLLSFMVKNSKPASHEVQHRKASGIGLNNLKNRLEILYPEKYSLELNDLNETYVAQLKIELS